MVKIVTAEVRSGLIAALRERYKAGNREQKGRILAEFAAISGYHRKSAIRILNGEADTSTYTVARGRRRVYDDAVRQTLIVLWEASDRVCGKRLRALMPILLPALERHGHLQLDPVVRDKLVSISAASMDRLLSEARAGKQGRKPRKQPSAVSKQVPIRTFADWDEPGPGYMEMDLVAHGGPTSAGSFAHTLSFTDIATGWTECVPLLVRDSSLVINGVESLAAGLPFPLQGLDADNGSEFLNEALILHCVSRGLEFTRSRPYHKNDQAWIEQKNGAVVRRFVGYGRLEGVAATEALGRLYRLVRLFVNFFQPSFKLKEKVRIGSRVVKRYHPPQTPYVRLLGTGVLPEAVLVRLRNIANALDPLDLLAQIRHTQEELAMLSQGRRLAPPSQRDGDLTSFLSGLSTAWQLGEVRPTHHAPPRPTREWRTRKDPFETVWPTLCSWLAATPDATAKDLLSRLQNEQPGVFPDGQLRTLQRRLREWRKETAHKLVFGVLQEEEPIG